VGSPSASAVGVDAASVTDADSVIDAPSSEPLQATTDSASTTAEIVERIRMQTVCTAKWHARRHGRHRRSHRTGARMTVRPRILLDCDPGHDDVMAIIAAARCADLVGITTVAGNAPLERTTYNARV